MYRIRRTKQFNQWFQAQPNKEQSQIRARLAHIELEGHFGISRYLGENLAELKWGNGRRIYFAISVDTKGRIVVLLLGGNKNSQRSDILKARKILQNLLAGKYHE